METVYQENTIVLNVRKISTPNFIKETLLDIKSSVILNTIIVVDCHSPQLQNSALLQR
jgi:hypothetical protein